jgi:hypothetical protein
MQRLKTWVESSLITWAAKYSDKKAFSNKTACAKCCATSYVHMYVDHRNLRSRTSMSAQVLQIFWGKEHLEKNRLIFTLDKVIDLKGTIFCGLQNVSSLHKIGWRPAEKNSPVFFKMRVLYLDFYDVCMYVDVHRKDEEGNFFRLFVFLQISVSKRLLCCSAHSLDNPWNVRFFSCFCNQVCQIFLGKKYQNGKNIPNYH